MILQPIMPKFLQNLMPESALAIFNEDCVAFGWPKSGRDVCGNITMTIGNITWTWNDTYKAIRRETYANNLFWNYDN